MHILNWLKISWNLEINHTSMRNNPKESHNEEMGKFLSNSPGWFIHWGMTIIFLFILALIFSSRYVSYWDHVESSAKLYSKEPINVNSPTISGQRLFGKCSVHSRYFLELKVDQKVEFIIEKPMNTHHCKLVGIISSITKIAGVDSVSVEMAFTPSSCKFIYTELAMYNEVHGKAKISKRSSMLNKIFSNLQTLIKY